MRSGLTTFSAVLVALGAGMTAANPRTDDVRVEAGGTVRATRSPRGDDDRYRREVWYGLGTGLWTLGGLGLVLPWAARLTAPRPPGPAA